MPCSVSKEEELFYELKLNEEYYGIKTTNANILTMVACDLAEALEEKCGDVPMNILDVTHLWIDRHKSNDKEREMRKAEEKTNEKLRKGALTKLNEDERKALGLEK